MDPFKGLPRKLRILGKLYRVRVMKSVDGAEDTDGESDPEGQWIKIRRRHGFEQAKDTALHEIIHGIEHQLDLRLKETQVRHLATGLLAVMRDNPSVVKWLMARSEQA